MTARSSRCASSMPNTTSHDQLAAMNFLQQHAAEGQIVTGLLYVDSDPDDLHEHLNTVEAPLNALGERSSAPARPRSRSSTPGFASRSFCLLCHYEKRGPRARINRGYSEPQAVCGGYPVLNGMVVRHCQSIGGANFVTFPCTLT